MQPEFRGIFPFLHDADRGLGGVERLLVLLIDDRATVHLERELVVVMVVAGHFFQMQAGSFCDLYYHGDLTESAGCSLTVRHYTTFGIISGNFLCRLADHRQVGR